MDAGAPEPVTELHGAQLWVGYHANDPSFPGWGMPETAAWLEANASGQCGVVWFDGVTNHSLGPPSGERLHQHPMYGRGLTRYGFHEVLGSASRRWIVTFHDETLEVDAEAAHFIEGVVSARSPRDAIAMVREDKRGAKRALLDCRNFELAGATISQWELGRLCDELPLSQQAAELKEDLAQVHFPNGFVLDVGWISNGASNGEFVVLLAKAGQRESPSMRESASDVERLAVAIEKLVRFATET